MKYYVDTFPDFLILATDGSVIIETGGVGIHFRQLEYSFSARLPGYTPIFQGEMTAMIFSLGKIPANFAAVIVLSDSRGVCDPLEMGGLSKYFKEFGSLTPPHIMGMGLA